jgi:hypothetical protein
MGPFLLLTLNVSSVRNNIGLRRLGLMKVK